MSLKITPITTFTLELTREEYVERISLTPAQAIFIWNCIEETIDANHHCDPSPGWVKTAVDWWVLEVKVPFPHEIQKTNPMSIILEYEYPEHHSVFRLLTWEEVEELRVGLSKALRE